MGPDFLGRGMVVRPGQPGLPGAPRVPAAVESLEVLHACWAERRPVTVELTESAAALKEREGWTGDVFTLDPSFEFARERLHFLVWANNYDATREGEPIWWHSRLACRLGASPSTMADVQLDGEDLWVDGGPRGGLSVPVIHRESVAGGSLRVTRPTGRTGLELAPDQLAAVEHGCGPARIIAPAGSGKTRVLTERLRHLLVDRGYERQRVMALAYNRRAAQEMRTRCGEFKPVINTLHAFGWEILGRPRVLEERQQRGILHSLLALPKVLGQDPMAPYLEALGEVRLALRDPAVVEKQRGDVPGLAKAFPRYRARLRSEGVVDHDEQIYGALELLLADPEARKAAQDRCTHLLVDEFQDLTPAYLLLVRLLAGPAAQVFGVGDDDQVIYGYAGADPGFLIDYARFFPGAQAYALEVNYRCPGPVVEAASALLGRNKKRLRKTIRAVAAGASPDLVMVPAEAWAGAAVRKLQSWDPSSVAVLARTQATLMPLQVFLQEAAVPFESALDEQVLQRTGLRTALAYPRLSLRPDELTAGDLSEALRRPSRKLKREIVDMACQCRTLRQILALAGQQDPWPASQLEEFVDDLRRLGKRDAPGAIRMLREQVGLGTAMEELDRAASDSHLDDLIALEQTATLHPARETFEEWLRGHLRVSPGGGVRLSTVHRVKGMEWDRVLVYGLQAGLWPHRLAEDKEEERRVFHVAITRARTELCILGDSDRPSPFLLELTAPVKTVKRAAGTLEGLAGKLKVPVADLEDALGRLQDREGAVFRAVLVDGEKVKPVARRMGQTESMVKTWLQLSKRMVAEHLRYQGHGEVKL